MNGRYEKWMRGLLWTAAAALVIGTAALYAVQDRPEAAVPEPVTAAEGRGGVLDLNCAGTGALEELPGIGPALAERIVLFREENGPFDCPEALMAVPGIGPATWEAIEPFVYFGEGKQ